MIHTYKFGDKVIELFINLQRLLSPTKKLKIYKLEGGTKFLIRTNSLDKFIINETWQNNIYSSGDFSIKPKDIVVDLGAQIGDFAIYAAKKAYQGKVYAYEPFKLNYSLLKKNKYLNKVNNLFIYNLGLSNKNGKEKLFISKSNTGGHSSIESNSNKFVFFKTTTLNKALKKSKKVDLLKIDTEGAEYKILLSTSSKTLNKIKKIALEYHDFFEGNDYQELTSFLIKNGFAVKIEGNILIRLFFKQGIIKAWREN